MLQVTTFPFGCKASFVSPAETKGRALPEPTSFHLYSRLKFPLLQYNSRVDLLSGHSTAPYFAEGVDSSLSEVTHGINRSFLRLSIFVGGNETDRLIVLCLFWLSTKNGKKVRVLIYA